MASWVSVSSALAPRRDFLALEDIRPSIAGQARRGLSHSALQQSGLTLSPGDSFGHRNIKRPLNH